MKHWQEMGQLLARIVRRGREGHSSALATVIQIDGSAYRRPGAKLLIEDSGCALGGVSGGCLEEDVRQVGLEVLQSGQARVLHYDTSDDESKLWGLGLGCDGKVDVFVEPVLPVDALGLWTRVRELLDGNTAFALATAVTEGATATSLIVDGAAGAAANAPETTDSELLMAGRAALQARAGGLQTLGARQIFFEVLSPPPKLVVCGASDDARPLVTCATSVGFRVFVADHRRAYLTAERFPEAHALVLVRPEQARAELPFDHDTFVVIKTHSLKNDTTWVQHFLARDVPYIGVLGPRARTQKIVGELPHASRERIFGPVGLDLGADGPEQVALSIVAELLAIRSQRKPQHLREREASVHAR